MPIISAISLSGSGTAISLTKSHSPRAATASIDSVTIAAEHGLELAHHARREAAVDEIAQLRVARLGFVDQADLGGVARAHAELPT